MLGGDVIPVLEHILLFINLKPDIFCSKSSVLMQERRQTQMSINIYPGFQQGDMHTTKNMYFLPYLLKIFISSFNTHSLFTSQQNSNRQSRTQTKLVEYMVYKSNSS